MNVSMLSSNICVHKNTVCVLSCDVSFLGQFLANKSFAWTSPHSHHVTKRVSKIQHRTVHLLPKGQFHAATHSSSGRKVSILMCSSCFFPTFASFVNVWIAVT